MPMATDLGRWTCVLLLAAGLAALAAARAVAQTSSPIEIVPQIGHSGSVTAVAMSPDGRLMLSGSEVDNVAKLWDVETGLLLRAFTGHSNVVSGVGFAQGGTRVVTGSHDTTAKVFDVSSGRLIHTLAHDKPYGLVTAIAVSKDGRRLATGTLDGKLRVWELGSGTLLRTVLAHQRPISAVAFTPDGARVLSGSEDKTGRLWEVASGRAVLTLEGHSDGITTVAVSPDGRQLLTAGLENSIRAWAANTGRQVHMLKGPAGQPVPAGLPESRWRVVRSIAYAPDGTSFASAHGDGSLNLWEASSGKLVRARVEPLISVNRLAFSPDGRHLLAGLLIDKVELRDAGTLQPAKLFEGTSGTTARAAFAPDGSSLLVLFGGTSEGFQVWDAGAGRKARTLAVTSGGAYAFTPDGKAFVAASGPRAQLTDVSTAQALGTFEGHATGGSFAGFSGFQFTRDGAQMLSGGYDKTATLWDVSSGAKLRSFDGHWPAEKFYHSTSAVFSHDDRHVIVSAGSALRVYDAGTGRRVRNITAHSSDITFVTSSTSKPHVLSGGVDRSAKITNIATGAILRSLEGHQNQLTAGSFSPNGAQVATAGMDKLVKIWDANSGKLLRTLAGHGGGIIRIGYSPDGRRLVSGGFDGRVILWEVETGRPLAALVAGKGGEWLSMTPDGFFDSSHRDPGMLAIVSGLEATSIAQVFQSLLNPDMVRESLAGDPNGEVARAAKSINLEQVLGSGPAPAVAIVTQEPGASPASDVVTVRARITDRGKGVGRIEWRVNGITAAVQARPAGPGPEHSVTQELALDPGENVVEVVAYNGSNLLASPPARIAMHGSSPAEQTKPKLHVLTIGINDYVDRGWTPPGTVKTLKFGRLGLAVKDATSLAEALRTAGAGHYAEVRARVALDADATLAKLDRTIDSMAASIHPRDTFVLFAAAHGVSVDGHFYMIPQDYQGGTNPEALAKRAISQAHLQDWVANRIRAKRAIILLDTCESGALVGGGTRSRIDARTSEAAIGRLHEATGRPVLTAAAEGQFAHEGVVGNSGVKHGLFTWAILDALRNGDSNRNDKIELSELVGHVQSVVPALAARLGGAGRSATAVPVFGQQSARFGSRGEDFTLVGTVR
ncbi:MAG: hypothetical protein NW223_12755 [Hyphomicrobiaceae bacterium]|nr:hypothetical protein [Hyphomicrobiaceae bacterium]